MKKNYISTQKALEILAAKQAKEDMKREYGNKYKKDFELEKILN